MPTEMELVLEQTQQGTSHEVLVVELHASAKKNTHPPLRIGNNIYLYHLLLQVVELHASAKKNKHPPLRIGNNIYLYHLLLQVKAYNESGRFKYLKSAKELPAINYKEFFKFMYVKLNLKQILQPHIISSVNIGHPHRMCTILKGLIFMPYAPLYFFTYSCLILGPAMIMCILLALGGNSTNGPGSLNLGLRKTAAIIISVMGHPLGVLDFHLDLVSPTDEELVVHYLRGKVHSLPMLVSIILEVDVCKSNPWDLLGDVENERFFFSTREVKYPTDNNQQVVVGIKKTLVFYKGKPLSGTRTNWIMHKYRLASQTPQAKHITEGVEKS
nr:hypothetical protein [Tanacetum cinerariifolium]